MLLPFFFKHASGFSNVWFIYILLFIFSFYKQYLHFYNFYLQIANCSFKLITAIDMDWTVKLICWAWFALNYCTVVVCNWFNIVIDILVWLWWMVCFLSQVQVRQKILRAKYLSKRYYCWLESFVFEKKKRFSFTISFCWVCKLLSIFLLVDL